MSDDHARRSDLAHADESPADRRRRKHRERQRAYVERQRAKRTEATAAERQEEAAERILESVTAPRTKASLDAADRPKKPSPFQVFSIPTPAGVLRGEPDFLAHFSHSQSRDLSTISEDEWRRLPREVPEQPATLVTDSGRYSFMTSDPADRERVAKIAAEELGVEVYKVEVYLSNIAAGRVFSLTASGPS